MKNSCYTFIYVKENLIKNVKNKTKLEGRKVNWLKKEDYGNDCLNAYHWISFKISLLNLRLKKCVS